VDGTGAVLKNGGRVMKNVTGYDLVKLMAGSHGTLGVLSEVSFKVLPRAGTEATLSATGLSDDDAVRALSRALTSPFEVSGAAHEGDGATHVRIEGFQSSVAYRAEALKGLLAEFGDWQVQSDGSAAVWEAIRDVSAFGGAEGDVWRLSVTPSEAPAIAARVPSLGRLFDWGGGLVWLRVAPGTDVRAALEPVRGHATLIRADAETKARLGVFHPEPAPLAAISKGLREKFDPRGILNPGRMG
jgi:glycolate oxidase FAD binding subunit